MFDINGIVNALQNDPNTRRNAMIGGGGAAAGLAAGMLMSKSGRKTVGKIAKYGAVAAVGGLAYHAWNRSRQGQSGGAPQTAAITPTTAVPESFEAPPQGPFLPAPNDTAAQDQFGSIPGPRHDRCGQSRREN